MPLKPRLVSLEPSQVKLEDGSSAIALRDLMGALPGVVVVSPAAYWILAHMDGTRDGREVVAALAAAGLRVAAADVAQVERQARDAGLLHGPAYDALRAAALDAYRSAPRAPSCAGAAYPADPAELGEMLAGYFTHRDGPGPRTVAAESDVRLLVAPHIDFRRGGPTYAHAYGALDGSSADLYVVFGTAHASPPQLFTLTRQDFATPLGEVPVDRAAADALVAALGPEHGDELLASELVHVNEHSVEFQVVWLRWLLGDRGFTVLPVLCSSIAHVDDPAAASGKFLAALAGVTAGRRVCFVAGADLAHVGPQYGDDAAVSAEALAAFGAQDRRTLGFLERGDPAGFHRDANLDGGRRRLCGVAPIHAAMRAAGHGARLLHHGQWWDGTDAVGFAAAAG